MRRVTWSLAAAAVAVTVALGTASASAITPDRVVHTFGESDSHNPNSTLVLGTEGNFYGTTSGNVDGVDHGSVYRMDHAGTVTVIHIFDGADGDQPIGLTPAPDGSFYGVTQSGGEGSCPSGCGTVFRMTADGAVSVLHSFQSGTLDGSAPNPALALAHDGLIYGTTRLGPIVPNTGENWGIAFRINPATGGYKVLHAFGAADGTNPQGGLIRASDGNFYGVTNERGPNGSGTVFRLAPAGRVSVVHAFAFSDGYQPKAPLLQAANGRLYGTTERGGPSDAGVVFQLNLSGSSFTVLHAFAADAHDGYRPIAGLVQAPDGRIFGTTPLGGRPPSDPNRQGVVYRLLNTGTVAVLHTFTGPDGGHPLGTVTWGGDGHLYGTTFVGGSTGKGVAFRLL
jgi:uncharacterized repeat protein (TIGR03803 family)